MRSTSTPRISSFPFLAVAGGEMKVQRVSEHCYANIYVAEQFLYVRFEVDVAAASSAAGRALTSGAFPGGCPPTIGIAPSSPSSARTVARSSNSATRRCSFSTTKGTRAAKTTRRRLADLPDGKRMVDFAFEAGAPENPQWYNNLMANPEVTVETGQEKFKARATELKGAWSVTSTTTSKCALMPQFGEYEAKTTGDPRRRTRSHLTCPSSTTSPA